MTKANLFVLLQLALILLIFMECGLLTEFPWIILQAAAVLIGMWAILQFNFKDLAISPVPRQGAKLITNGPYLWIRNPMYLAVLLYCLPLAFSKPTVYPFFLGIALTTILIGKLQYEEDLLKEQYPEYRNYCKRSKKLIPFIY